MSGEARTQMLGRIRRALKRGPLDEKDAAPLRARLRDHKRNLIPRRAAGLDHRGQIALFTAMAEGVSATVARVSSARDVPGAVADYLSRLNLPARLVMAPDHELADIPWAARPLLEIRKGRAEDGDAVGVTSCFAAVAETGTLMLLSGPESPTRNNFLPDTHIVVLRANRIAASYEDGFDNLRRKFAKPEGGFAMPRTVNFITGPSRTADIEQKIELGAHGPRRLHIVLVDEGGDGQA
jgi:L-lactate dehydrogenase complex protein LldG